MTDEHRDSLKPGPIPLLPVMGSLTMYYAWMLEVGAALGHAFSGGKWPATVKYWVIGGVALFATVYKMKLPKGNSAYVRVLSHMNLTPKQVTLMLCFLLGWVALFVWLVIGPPGPGFAPK